MRADGIGCGVQGCCCARMVRPAGRGHLALNPCNPKTFRVMGRARLSLAAGVTVKQNDAGDQELLEASNRQGCVRGAVGEACACCGYKGG